MRVHFNRLGVCSCNRPLEGAANNVRENREVNKQKAERPLELWHTEPFPLCSTSDPSRAVGRNTWPCVRGRRLPTSALNNIKIPDIHTVWRPIDTGLIGSFLFLFT